MQRTLQWLYATKWEPKVGKYICNRLLCLWCKLLKIQCGLNPIILLHVSCQSVCGCHGHDCFRIRFNKCQLFSSQEGQLPASCAISIKMWSVGRSVSQKSGHSLRDWEFWFCSVSNVESVSTHVMTSSWYDKTDTSSKYFCLSFLFFFMFFMLFISGGQRKVHRCMNWWPKLFWCCCLFLSFVLLHYTRICIQIFYSKSWHMILRSHGVC